VGNRLQDHPFFYNVYALKRDLNAMKPAAGALIWTRSQNAEPADLDLHISGTHIIDPKLSPTGGAIVLACAVALPKSIGWLRLSSRDPRAAPHIHYNFFDDENDLDRLVEAVRLSRKIGRTAPFSDLIDREIAPGKTVDDSEALRANIVSTIGAYLHPTSTVPMGTDSDPTAVVDAWGKVRGVEGLRVDAGSQEDGGAPERTRGQNDIARPENLAIDELHTDGALAFDNDAVHFSVTADREIGASADPSREIRHPRVDAHTIDDVERIGADAMLGRPVEIRYIRQPDGFRGFDEGTHRRGVFLRRPLADRERAGAAVPGVIAGRRVLQGLVRGEHLLPGPSLDPTLGPTREVGRSRPHRHGGVHRRAAADHAATGHGDVVAEAGGVLGVVLPIEGGRACNDIRVRQDWGVAVGRKILARLKQQDAALCIGAQSRRKNCAGRAAPHNNQVEGLVGSAGQ
jgi:hypothetical protein